jgi:predicted RNase H-like HicB family nuclease
VGRFLDRSELPLPVQDANDKLAPTLRRYGYRNWLSLEMRIDKEGTGWVIDPCCRDGSPPGEVKLLAYENLAEILWAGANGTVIEPEPAGAYAVQLILHSDWNETHWLPIQFPAAVRDNVKLKNATRLKDEYYVVPQGYKCTIGGVCACADSLEDAIAEVKEIAAQVEGYYIDAFADALDEAQEEIDKAKPFGVTL